MPAGIMPAMSAALWALLALQASASGYLALLAAAATARRRPSSNAGACRTRFAVVAPARDEELRIRGLLDSLARQRYPSDKFSVHVVADNCTDATAAIARRLGATVHERIEPDWPGQGRALRWLLERIDESEIDAFVFLDAGSRLSENFLSVMDARLQEGRGEALQPRNGVLEPASSPRIALRALAYALRRHVRGRGKTAFGLSCGLWGNGLVISRSLLRAAGWRSFTTAEHAEQHARLLLAGARVAYVPEAEVLGETEARNQQRRWARGRGRLLATYSRPLLGAAWRQRSASPLAALAEIALPPLPVLAVSAAVLAAAAWTGGSPAQAWLGVASLAALSGHIAAGLLGSGLPAKTYLALAPAPRFIVRQAWGYLRTMAEPARTRAMRDRGP